MQERLSLGRGQAKRGGRASERRPTKPSQVDLVRARAHSFGGTDMPVGFLYRVATPSLLPPLEVYVHPLWTLHMSSVTCRRFRHLSHRHFLCVCA
jgi:hypothetical protein